MMGEVILGHDRTLGTSLMHFRKVVNVNDRILERSLLCKPRRVEQLTIVHRAGKTLEETWTISEEVLDMSLTMDWWRLCPKCRSRYIKQKAGA